jgi:hypothetical protein
VPGPGPHVTVRDMSWVLSLVPSRRHDKHTGDTNLAWQASSFVGKGQQPGSAAGQRNALDASRTMPVTMAA